LNYIQTVGHFLTSDIKASLFRKKSVWGWLYR